MNIKDIKIIFTDFDGVLTNNKVITSQDGSELVSSNKYDGVAIQNFKKFGIEVIIISTDENPVVLARAKKLGVQAYNKVKNKGELIEKIKLSKKIKKNECIFIGNDINDLDAFDSVGSFCTVLDAYFFVKLKSKYVIPVKGGKGVLRYLNELYNYQINSYGRK